MQTLATFEKALKEVYLPVWNNQLSTSPSPFLAKIKKVPLTGGKITATAPIGLSGGFGFGAEGLATPQAGGVNFQKFTADAKDMYVNIVLSNKVIALTKAGGAMANALDVEVKSAYDTAAWNVGRTLFGDGLGKLTTISALENAGNTVTVADVSKLVEGLIIDFYATGAEVDSTPAVAGRRITSIDRANKTVTFSGTATTLAAGFITVQNSYGREITGLGAIYNDSITSLYGVTKSSNNYLKPIVLDAQTDIDDGTITKALRQSKNEKNGEIDMILCGDDAFDAYVTYLRANNMRVEEKSQIIKGGFTAIKFLAGNKEIDIVNDKFVPAKEMWGVDTTAFTMHQDDWGFVNQQGGGIFNLMENSSLFRGLLANYGELMCSNPGSCIRIINCA